MDSAKKIRVFNWGGGVFWVRSDLDSAKKIRVFNFVGGGVLGKVGLGLWKEFQFQGGGVLGKVRLGL